MLMPHEHEEIGKSKKLAFIRVLLVSFWLTSGLFMILLALLA